VVLFLGYFDQVPTLKVFNIIIFKFIELVVELLMIFKPQLHHRWSICVISIELLPSCGFMQFLHSDIVFPDWLIFPLESGCIDLSPEGE
jgi:hypothetical protein